MGLAMPAGRISMLDRRLVQPLAVRAATGGGGGNLGIFFLGGGIAENCRCFIRP